MNHAEVSFPGRHSAEGTAGLLREGGTGRRAMFEEMFAELGGTIEAFYYAFGKDDLYMIVDLPDDAAAVAASLNVGSAGGAITFGATVLITPETVDEATQRSVTYCPPGA